MFDVTKFKEGEDYLGDYRVVCDEVIQNDAMRGVEAHKKL